MQDIKVGRYDHPSAQEHWQGWIEPEDRSWIIFVAANGELIGFLNRDPETGAVTSPPDDLTVVPPAAR